MTFSHCTLDFSSEHSMLALVGFTSFSVFNYVSYMSSWAARVSDDWLKNRTPYNDSDTFVET